MISATVTVLAKHFCRRQQSQLLYSCFLFFAATTWHVLPSPAWVEPTSSAGLPWQPQTARMNCAAPLARKLAATAQLSQQWAAEQQHNIQLLQPLLKLEGAKPVCMMVKEKLAPLGKLYQYRLTSLIHEAIGRQSAGGAEGL